MIVSANFVPAFSTLKCMIQREKARIPQPNPKVRYIVVSNRLLHSGRLVFVLVDEQSFSEQNLKEVFQLVSKRYPKPDQLWITVFTNLEQYPTPEEEDYMQLVPSDDSMPFITKGEKHPIANYSRLEGNEAFEYSRGDGQEKKRVVLSQRP